MTYFITGELRRGREIGKQNRRSLFIWHSCETCGAERWVPYTNRVPKNRLCFECSCHRKMEQSSNWRGGRALHPSGYYYLKLDKNDFFYPMANYRGYVLEHRLVMAKHLGRCLHKWELVHHGNHIKVDNSISNLQLVGSDRHNQLTILETRIRELEQRVILLEAENVLLKAPEGAMP